MSEASIDIDIDIDISALVVNYNTTRLALEMLQSLKAQAPCTRDGRALVMEFVFVDNASPIQDPEALAEIRSFAAQEMPGQVIMNESNDGYGGGMNLAYEKAKGNYLLVLNPDLVFLPSCVERLYAALSNDRTVGAVGPVGYWERGKEVRLPPNILPTLKDLIFSTLAHGFIGINRRYTNVRLTKALRSYEAKTNIDLDMLSGACLMLPRELIEEMGQFFDAAFPLYYEDTDLFRRIQARGRSLLLVHDAEMAHFYNRSGTTVPKEAMERYVRAKSYYYRKYYGFVGGILERLSRSYLGCRMAQRARRKMQERVIDLGDVADPPTLEFGRHCERFVLEMCQDAAFLLAAAIFGTGDCWRPGESFWHAFGNSEYFFRVVDLSSGRPEELAVFRFRRIDHPALPKQAG